MTRATLVEQNNPVVFRVKKLAVQRRQTGARATMQKQDRCAIRVATLFPVQRVQPVYDQPPGSVRFNRWIHGVNMALALVEYA